MSSCFDITLKYKAKDSEGLDKALKDRTRQIFTEREIEEWISRDKVNPESGTDILNHLFSFQGKYYGRKAGTDGEGWNTLQSHGEMRFAYVFFLEETFSLAAPFLEDGSTAEIVPDGMTIVMTVKDGQTVKEITEI